MTGCIVSALSAKADRVQRALALLALWLLGFTCPVLAETTHEPSRSAWSQVVAAEQWPQLDEPDWWLAWPAWLRSCQVFLEPHHPKRAIWQTVCLESQKLEPTRGAEVQRYFQTHFDLYQARTNDPNQTELGLATGYFEPELDARADRLDPAFSYPLYGLPRQPIRLTRAQIVATHALAGRELFWFRDPIEAYFLEVQGSGIVRLPDGQRLRLSYAGNNGQDYRSIGRWLIHQHELDEAHVSMQAIRDWAHQHPNRLQEMLNQNPRMVFFTAHQLDDTETGPRGAIGVPLTAGVSAAVDPSQLPQGAPMVVSPTRHDDGEPVPEGVMANRLLVAQDTGAAIKGPLRLDWFWGTGEEAGAIAGHQHTLVKVFVLVPHGSKPEHLLP